MEEGPNYVTVYRSADAQAAEQAETVKAALEAARIPVKLLDSAAPGIPPGVWEVRVPEEYSFQAEPLVDAALTTVARQDNSDGLDLAPLFSSDAHDAEMEAMTVYSLLQANGIDAVLVGPSVLPVLRFEVLAPKRQVEEAKRILQQAREAGRAGLEAEAESAEGSSR